MRERLEELGYGLDPRDDTLVVHQRLGLRLVDGHGLVGLPDDVVDAFHHPGTFAPLGPPPRVPASTPEAQAWMAAHRWRKRGTAVGLVVMVTWLFVGWLIGVWWWLGGMVAIGAATWAMRPQPMPDALQIPDPGFEGQVQTGIDALGQGWREAAVHLGAVQTDAGLELRALGLRTSVETLHLYFEPAELLAVANCVVPADPPDADHSSA